MVMPIQRKEKRIGEIRSQKDCSYILYKCHTYVIKARKCWCWHSFGTISPAMLRSGYERRWQVAMTGIRTEEGSYPPCSVFAPAVLWARHIVSLTCLCWWPRGWRWRTYCWWRPWRCRGRKRTTAGPRCRSPGGRTPLSDDRAQSDDGHKGHHCQMTNRGDAAVRWRTEGTQLSDYGQRWHHCQTDRKDTTVRWRVEGKGHYCQMTDRGTPLSKHGQGEHYCQMTYINKIVMVMNIFFFNICQHTTA